MVSHMNSPGTFSELLTPRARLRSLGNGRCADTFPVLYLAGVGRSGRFPLRERFYSVARGFVPGTPGRVADGSINDRPFGTANGVLETADCTSGRLGRDLSGSMVSPGVLLFGCSDHSRNESEWLSRMIILRARHVGLK